MRPRFALALLSLLAACNPPLRGGIYTITITAVRDDSCGVGTDLVGFEDDGSVWWEDGETMVLATTSGEWWWHWDGEEFTYSQTTTEAWESDCDATYEEDFVGSIVEADHFAYQEWFTLDLAGACVGYDKGMMPCTMELDYDAVRTAD